MISPSLPDKDIRIALPESLGARLEAHTGLRILAVRRRAGGGASRDGAELELVAPDGEITRAYLSFDTRRTANAQRILNFRREASVLSALSGRLAHAGVKVARVLATDEDCLALLSEWVEGDANFNKLKEPEQRLVVGLDLMRQLAALHALEPEAARLEEVGAPEQAWAELIVRIGQRHELAMTRRADPQIVFALGWLKRHVPPPPRRVALLHGDCGPGNFLYQDGKVTANLDWELTRFGDPMEDLAMLCIRDLIQTFIPLPDAFAAYEAAGGDTVDLARLRYHRLSNQLGFMTLGLAQEGPAPEPPVLGMSMVFNAMHMRVMVEQLAELAKVELAQAPLPDAPPSRHGAAFETALNDLRDVIVPGASDQLAAEKGKGLARLVKYWRDRERYGATYDQAEVEDIQAAIGGRFASLGDARDALRSAIAEDQVEDAACINLFHRRAARETAIMADAMGGLARTHFSPLERG